MTREEAIKTIEVAIAEVEWEHPMDYAAALEMAIKALREPEVVRCRECKHKNTKKCPMVIVNFNSDMEEMLVQNHVSDDFFCSYGEQKDGNSNG